MPRAPASHAALSQQQGFVIEHPAGQLPALPGNGVPLTEVLPNLAVVHSTLCTRSDRRSRDIEVGCFACGHQRVPAFRHDIACHCHLLHARPLLRSHPFCKSWVLVHDQSGI